MLAHNNICIFFSRRQMALSIIWDLDGVITDTSSLHRQAWIETIVDFIGPSNHEYVSLNYHHFFSGVPRSVGIKRFLASTGNLHKNTGSHDELAIKISNRKNQRFRHLVTENPISVFPDALQLLKLTRKLNIKNGLASQSENADFVTEKAGIREYLTSAATGITARHHNIQAKPHPEFYLHAAQLLNSSIGESIVIEDTYAGALSAISAGSRMCIGVARDQAQTMELISAGCDLVTRDLFQIVDLIDLNRDSYSNN
jgi:HAD superfamily hydrolase (TIGR01509 family)